MLLREQYCTSLSQVHRDFSAHPVYVMLCLVRLRFKCDGTRAETRFRLSAKWTSPFKSAWGVSSVDYWQPRCAPLAVVMLDTLCSEVVWRVLATVQLTTGIQVCASAVVMLNTPCSEVVWRVVATVQTTTGSQVCASAVVMLDTPCSEVVWRVLATHSIRQIPLHFPSRASPCAITF
jgi:hypothetical protein